MLSVIVPVYNVEKYINKCVDSILNQKYKDLEVILVDDGSKDRCPQILDEYEKKDSRVRVIHKENGGLSDARNKGIEAAGGEYITFVDSDDYIDENMYKYMMQMFEEGADMVVCPFAKVEENDDSKYCDASGEGRFLSHQEVMKKMFSPQEYAVFIVAWNKVYKRSLWGELRFPVGRIHEDEFTSYIPLCKSKRTGYLFDAYYFYRQRNGSIMSIFKEKACLDNVNALEEKINYFKNMDRQAYSMCLSRSLETMIYYYDKAISNNAGDTATQIRNIFLRAWDDALKNDSLNLSRERKMYFKCFAKSFQTMKKVMPFYWKWEGFSRKVAGKSAGIKRAVIGRVGVYYKSNPKVASIEDTINKIINDHVSVSRFGDGEFKWMAQIPNVTFQENSPVMAKRLQEISVSDNDNHIVCVTDVFGSLKKYNKQARHFWYDFMGEYRKLWISYLKPGKQYYNTNMTRPYMDYIDKTPCKERFELLKKIWEKRDIILIEGEKSRLGIGNDLFDNAKSVKRILAPALNAFARYDEILDAALAQDKDALFIIALGPTATILAYDLSTKGRQAIDAGHVDIEYEWFLQGATQKVTIKNKYVNEVDAGKGVGELADEEYQSQIIMKIIR